MNRLTWCLGVLSLLSLGPHSLAAEGWLRNGVSSTVGFVGRALRPVTQYATGKDAPPTTAVSKPVLSSLDRELKCTRCAAVPCCCPDDYCRKPLPCIACPQLPSTCDNYCRKPLPCIQVPCLPGCPDDYCRRPFPQLCWPANPDCHCGPDCDGHAGHSQKAWTRVRFWP